VEAGDIWKVRLLLDHGADFNKQVGYYGRPLGLAAKQDDVAVTQLLISRGADVNLIFRSREKFGTALDVAIVQQKLRTLDSLLEGGGDPNLPVDGLSPLATAAKEGNCSAISRLIQHGAKVDMKLTHEEYGSALIVATRCEALDSLESLVEHGADVNLEVDAGTFRTALQAS
jgi:ankyrin repeat protein